ncbi:type II secretion system F family protein [Oxalobacteraceae bacterium A2-2]
MSHIGTDIPITLLALAAGLAAALASSVVAYALSGIPSEDRSFKDRPPLGFRLLWWPIHWISHMLRPFIARSPGVSLPTRLRKAGLDYAISPAQFVSSRVCCAVIAAVFCCWVLDSLVQGAAVPGAAAVRYWQAGLAGAVAGWSYVGLWLRDRIAARRRELQKSLPFYLDLITLCVEAGLNLQGALRQAVTKGPPGPLAEEFKRVMRDIRSGKARAEALRAMSERLQEPAVSSFLTSLIQAERMGMNLGPMLRAQADQRRVERFLRAEKLAMEAPVKLLFPLIAFIFPCTFIVLFFPIVIQFMHSGL